MTPRAACERTAKCNICGKFRRREDVVMVDYSDSHPVPLVEECKSCTAPAELITGDFWSLFTDELAAQVVLTTAEINAGKASN